MTGKNSTNLPTPEEMAALMATRLSGQSKHGTVVKLTPPLSPEERAQYQNPQKGQLLTPAPLSEKVQIQNTDSSTPANTLSNVELISLDLIDPPPIAQRQQYTEEMINLIAQDIRKNGHGDNLSGQIHPVVVMPSSITPGRFVMVDGFTRLMAFKQHFLAPQIKAIVRHDLDPKAAFKVALSANVARNSVTDYDTGMAMFEALRDGTYKDHSEIANDNGMSLTTVSGLLAFSDLPEEVHELIKNSPQKFTYNFAARLKALYNKTNVDVVRDASKKIAEGKMTFSKLQTLISNVTIEQGKTVRKKKNSRTILSYGKVRSTEDSVSLVLESLPHNVSQALAEYLEKATVEFLQTHISSEAQGSDV